MHIIRNILLLTIVGAIISCSSNQQKEESSSGHQWQSLFNGKNLDGWVAKINHHELGENYARTFRVKDGKIQVNYNDYEDFNEQFGHLFYREPFSSYHLKFEYRFTDQWREDAPSYAYRNSGVMFHAQDPQTIQKDQDWPIAVEYQILAEQEKGTPRPTGNVCTPGTDIYYQGEKYTDHCLNSSSQTFSWERWVSGELIVYRDSLITHLINGDTVLQYTRPQIGGGTVTGFDPSVKTDGKTLTGGYIALQSEGHGIEFRKIKIRELE